MAIAAATREGELLAGAYELRKFVRADGPFDLYDAVERADGRGVSVRLLRPEYALQSGVVDKVLRCPRTLGAVAHPSLPRVRVDTDDIGTPFVVEDALEGSSLESLLAQHPQGMPLGLATHLIAPIVEALAIAHDRRVYHGAISPSQIVLAGSANAPVPKLLNLGRVEAGDARTDVGALGALLYRMLSGEAPERARGGRVTPLDEVAPHLPQGFVELVHRCMDPDSSERLTDARAVLEALHELAPQAVGKPRAAAPEPDPAPAEQDDEPEISFEPAAAEQDVSLAATQLGRRSERPNRRSDDPKPKQEAERTMSAVAAAFGPLAGEGQAAEPAPEKEALERKKKKAAVGQIAKGLGVKVADASKKPGEKPQGEKPLTEGQKAAIGLTDAQLAALRGYRQDGDDRTRRWVELALLLLFLVALQGAMPLLYQPRMVKAQELLGSAYRFVAAGFAVSALIVTARVWAAKVKARSPFNHVLSYTMQIVAACVCVLTAASMMKVGALGMIELGARRALPWAASFLFFMFALTGTMRGVRNLAQNAIYAVLVMALSTGSLYGSYRAVLTTVVRVNKKKAALRERAGTETEADIDARTKDVVTATREALSDKTSLSDWQETHQDMGSMAQRKTAGDSEDSDLKAVTEFQNVNKQNAQTLKDLQQSLGAPSDAEEAIEAAFDPLEPE